MNELSTEPEESQGSTRARPPPRQAPRPGAGVPRAGPARAVGSPERCPVCQTAVLQGRQTVCSAACRRARSRRRHADRLAERDAELRRLAEALLRVLDSR